MINTDGSPTVVSIPAIKEDRSHMRRVTLYIPKDQRLGQAIMNAFREDWDRGFLLSGCVHKFWDIWQKDDKDIQRAIDRM